MKEKILKEYDIRGKYGSEMGEEEARLIVRAFVYFLKIKEGEKIIMGRDRSINSKKIFDFVRKELINSGITAVDIGEVTSPLFNWAMVKEGIKGGMMMTASHLGDEYAGIKLEGEKGTVKPREIESFLRKEIKIAGKKGIVEKKDFLKDYAFYQAGKIRLEKRFRIVIDSSSGMGGKILEEALKEKVASLKKICFQKCSHEDDILKEKNQKDLKEALKKGKFDLGVLFDGDGDRVLFFDEKGSLIAPEVILAILTDYFKPKCFVGNEMVIEEVRKIVEKNGGKCEETKTGHSFIKEKMREKRASLGGEHSGHIYFSDKINGKDFYSEAPILAVLSILKILEEKEKKMSQVTKEFDVFFRSGEKNVKIRRGDFNRVKERIIERYKKEKIEEKDGVTIQGEDFWFNLRMSNTEDLLRINLKAENKEIGKEKIKEVLKLVK